MNILFAGSSVFSMPSLIALNKHGYAVEVLTSHPKHGGRGKHLIHSPVEHYAHEHKMRVHTPLRLDRECIDSFRKKKYDMLVCVSYGKIFGPRFLGLFDKHAINVHPSLLPKYRGPSPIAAALMNGDSHTGVCVQRMAQDMDAGDVLLQSEETIADDDDHSSLQERLAQQGAALLLRVLSCYPAIVDKAEPQNDDESTYCTKIRTGHRAPHFAQDARRFCNIVRGMVGHGGVCVTLRDDTIRIMSSFVVTNHGDASCEDWGRVCEITHRGIYVQMARGIIAFKTVQRAGKRSMDAFDFSNGMRLRVGELFLPLRR